METKRMINQLKRVANKHMNDTLRTFDTNITALCRDVVPKLEVLARYEETGLTPEEIMDGKMLTGWIPVEDRLPEESLNSVIGWDEYRKRCCFVQYYCGRWILGNDVGSVKITAWMPLPEPYTEQTNG